MRGERLLWHFHASHLFIIMVEVWIVYGLWKKRQKWKTFFLQKSRVGWSRAETCCVRLRQTFTIARRESTVVNALGNQKPFGSVVVRVLTGLQRRPEGRHLKRLTAGVGVLQDVWLEGENVLSGRLGCLGRFRCHSVYDTVPCGTTSAQTRTLTIGTALFWHYNDKRMPDLHLLSEAGVPETSQEVRTMLLCLLNRTLCPLYPWHARNTRLRNLYTLKKNFFLVYFFPKHFQQFQHFSCGANSLIQSLWKTAVLDRMRLVGVEHVVGSQIIRFLYCHYLFLFCLVPNQPACPLKSAGLHLSVFYQPRSVTRALETTAAQPTQTQMFSLVLRLNIREGGTKKEIQQEMLGLWGRPQPTSALSSIGLRWYRAIYTHRWLY